MDRKMIQEMEDRRTARLNLVRTADRSEKIRTYNYAQVITQTCSFYSSVTHVRLKDRVTDHRIGLTLKNLAGVMEGGQLREILDALKRNYEEEVMEEMLDSV